MEGFDMLISSITTELQSNNSIQQYFKEINDIYNKHNNEYDIEYCPENRDKLIEMNLKTVISIAKKYQGLGLSLSELISAGNLGLVIAWDKFDPSRSSLKDNVMAVVDTLGDEVTYNELNNSISTYLSYGDVRKKFDEKFQPHKTYKKQEIIRWVNANIYNAKFNSIATMWIRAYILIEIDNHSRIVKKPKSEIYRDREEFGAYKKEVVVDIDAPISDSTDVSMADLLTIEDDTQSVLEVSEAYDIFKDGLNKLLDGVKTRDRTVFLKKFGIGLPRPMLPKEIAEQEGLSIARVSQIFQSVMEQMQMNQVKYNINPNILFEAVKKIQ
jgi:RNA polymerase primary sigma factor